MELLIEIIYLQDILIFEIIFFWIYRFKLFINIFYESLNNQKFILKNCLNDLMLFKKL